MYSSTRVYKYTWRVGIGTHPEIIGGGLFEVVFCEVVRVEKRIKELGME